MITFVYRYYSMLFDVAIRTIGVDGITADLVRGIRGGLDTLHAVINGKMSLDQAGEYVNDKANDGLPGIDMTRRIVARAMTACAADESTNPKERIA